MKNHNESSVTIHVFPVGQMGANCYLVVDRKTREAVVVDPGDEASFLAEQIVRLEAKPVKLLATHGHFDHLLAAAELQMIFTIPFLLHEKDSFLLSRMTQTAAHFLGYTVVEQPPKLTKPLTQNDRILFGNAAVRVIHTPGHTPGSVCFYLEQNGELFTGDTLFAGGSVGRSDFSYSDPHELTKSVKEILRLPTSVRLFPGHGQSTSIGVERSFQV